jgi:hypothetical protein
MILKPGIQDSQLMGFPPEITSASRRIFDLDQIIQDLTSIKNPVSSIQYPVSKIQYPTSNIPTIMAQYAQA